MAPEHVVWALLFTGIWMLLCAIRQKDDNLSVAQAQIGLALVLAASLSHLIKLV